MSEVFNLAKRPRAPSHGHLQPNEFVRPDRSYQTVFAGNAVIERFTDQDDQSAHYLVRVAPYRDSDRRTAGVVITSVNVTGMTRAEARQQVSIADLQHRTRNLLAVVQSIARETLGQSIPVEAFNNRLAALGRLQGLLGKGDFRFCGFGR